jgi:hypothetical protein
MLFAAQGGPCVFVGFIDDPTLAADAVDDRGLLWPV